MSRYAIRILIIVGSLAIIGILTVQLYFVNHSYQQENKQLDQSIRIALQQVAEKLFDYHESELPYENIIHQYSSNYYIVNINNIVDVEILEYYLTKEFESRGLDLDFEYAIYDCATDKMVYGNYVNLTDKELEERETKVFPKWDEYLYYFGIYFPNKKQLVADNLGVWYFITIIMLVVVIFFAYAMFVILRQKRLSEIQKDFIHNMTHEFKTPLTTILLSADVMNENGIINEPNRLQKYASIIKEQASHLHDQVIKVLNSSINDKAKLNLKTTEINIVDFVEETLHSFDARFQCEQVSLQINNNTIQEFIVKADPIHFKNMLINIIDNAVKYSNPPRKITVNISNNNKQKRLEIKDNGLGIEKKYTQKVFDKFFRIPTGNIHNVKGFGIGLSYVKNLARAHKWKIILESTKGQGTSFIINF